MLSLMIEHKAARFRLYPTPEQAAQMAQIAGACRFIYNLALEQRQSWSRPGRTFSFASQCRPMPANASQCRDVTMLRAEVEWLKAAPIHPLQQALRDLDRAYQNWWAKRAGAPTPRKKALNDSFRFPDPVSLRLEGTSTSSGRLKLPKLGWVKLRGWQKAGLNPAIVDQGWSLFRTMLDCKLADRGGRLVDVPAAYTRKTCSACGLVEAASRRGQARFICVGCGHAANVDSNAALNILRCADSALKPIEGNRSKRPGEAGTTPRKAA